VTAWAERARWVLDNTMLTWAIRALRLVLIALVGMMILLGTFSFPGMFFFNNSNPRSWIDWALFVGIEIAIAAVLVIVIGAWKVLTLVQNARTFGVETRRWLRVMTIAAALVSAIFASALVLLGLTGDDPGPGVVLMVFFLISATLTLLSVVASEVVKQAASSESQA